MNYYYFETLVVGIIHRVIIFNCKRSHKNYIFYTLNKCMINMGDILIKVKRQKINSHKY